MIKVKSLRRLFSTPRTKGTLSLDSLYKNIESSEISSVCLVSGNNRRAMWTFWDDSEE